MVIVGGGLILVEKRRIKKKIERMKTRSIVALQSIKTEFPENEDVQIACINAIKKINAA